MTDFSLPPPKPTMQQDRPFEFRYPVTPRLLEEPRPAIPYLHIFLFLATVLTTTHVGALQDYPDIIGALWHMSAGLSFSLPLLMILLTHELGHYVASRKRGIDVTLPYFIPLPVVSIIGTMGAFIRLKSMVPDRRALFDVGAAGPLAGVVIAIPVSLIGLKLSQVAPLTSVNGGLHLGDSLLFWFFQYIVLGIDTSAYTVILHPMAFAGWVGLFVTALNLIPAGQLDGGHIAYALVGKKHLRLTQVMVGIMILLGFKWPGWFFWALIISLTMAKLRHPPVVDHVVPLDSKRRWLAMLTMLVFITTFTPVPFQVQ